VPEFLRSLAQELRRDLLYGLSLRWSELGALEQFWQELSEEFAGEDPVAPQLRAKANETRERLLRLAAEFGGKRRLLPPSEDQLGELRRLVDDAFDNLRPLL
jgi:hypothetical protein